MQLLVVLSQPASLLAFFISHVTVTSSFCLVRHVQVAYKVVMNAPAVLVVPHTDAAVDELTISCPCGDASLWEVESPRRLTTCPSGTHRQETAMQRQRHMERERKRERERGAGVEAQWSHCLANSPSAIQGSCKTAWNWFTSVGTPVYGNMQRLDVKERE